MKTLLLRLTVLTLASAALAACDDGAASSANAARPGAMDARQHAARAAADASLKSRLRRPELLQQRGVQVFTQALPDTLAVCGRSRAAEGSGEAFIPYVAVVAFDGSDAPRVTSFTLGATNNEASRVFVEMVDRCFEGGGPATARTMARAYPPLPTGNVLADAAREAAPPVETTAEATPATPRAPHGMVTVSARSAANIRSSTQGGQVVRTVPRSSTLEVLGEAPGGWFQVGEGGQAYGWVHSSVLETASR
ncbi:SH3 domain-containing protein [Roseococcus sp. YIM B11640]|uniref:SH3 domain-containing protein n=1 Tax=Roseococcus sp. YIM B11640 TaxID=3133973 RepID=UPI003C7D700D